MSVLLPCLCLDVSLVVVLENHHPLDIRVGAEDLFAPVLGAVSPRDARTEVLPFCFVSFGGETEVRPNR